MAGWEEIVPKVNESAEFLEIASDFGDPLELFREALQGATEFKIIITVSEIRGQDKLVIELIDNGTGMSRDTISNHFWNLGDSKLRGNKNAIGEEGHGTKIYLRSDRVLVQTNDGIYSYETECEGAFFSLNAGEVHCPKVRKSDQSFPKGTYIRIEGYNDN